MDWVETAVMRKAGLRGEMLMFSSSDGAAGPHPLLYLQSPLLSSPSAEEPAPACASVDRSAAWENFSVDDLLDLGGGGKEQNGGDDDFLRAAEAEDEEDDDEEEEEERTEKEEKDSSSTAFNGCSSSALSFQALPSPSSGSDPIVPAGDLADLEWVSRFVDDSYSEFPSAVVAPAPLQNHHAPAPAPVPEAAEAPRPQRTSSCTTSKKRTWGSCCFSTDSLVVPAKVRSKRSGRTAGRVWSLVLPPLLAESSTSSCSSGSSSASCSASSSIFSCLLYDKLDSGGPGGGIPVSFQPALPEVKKKKGRKPKALTVGTSAAASGGCGEHAQTRRRCTHCGVDKTPQWRAGPMGAKTLCNACGVRYKSGRLLPEYRPAGSPTFLSQVHSNSHRKVLEMRRRKELPEEGAASPLSASCSLLPPPPLLVASQPYGVV